MSLPELDTTSHKDMLESVRAREKEILILLKEALEYDEMRYPILNVLILELEKGQK